MNGFEYFLIAKAKGVNGYAGIREPVDGILGMSRGLPPKTMPDFKIGPNLVKYLQLVGHSFSNVFAFYMTDTSS
jgi:hypothetical protein